MGEYNHNPFSYWMKGDSLVHWSEHQGIPLTDDAPEFCWVDIETTGLDRTQDRILEIGLVLTNGIGEVCMDGVIDWRVFVHGGNEDQKGAEYLTALSRLESNPIVSEMHKKSGLLLNIFSDARHPEYMKTHPDIVQVEARNWLAERTKKMENGLQLSGSSPHFDRGFLQDQMPYLEDWFHYRSGVDVSALRETFKRINEAVVKTQPEKQEKHRPIPDLADSIRLYRHMLRTGFVCAPRVMEKVWL
jgi:oligoribonuclease